jgi:hypothetical protein
LQPVLYYTVCIFNGRKVCNDCLPLRKEGHFHIDESE